jgi:hypothetical protein
MRPTIPDFLVPSSVAVLAVLESVFFGLAARLAYDDGRTAAVWMTLIFVSMPMVLGFESVASGRERLGFMSPAAYGLMLLTAWVAWGGIGPVAVLILTPMFMTMALLGGGVAHLLRAMIRFVAWLIRAAASLRDGSWREHVARLRAPRAVAEGAPTQRVAPESVRPPADPGDAWRQIIIRMPF